MEFLYLDRDIVVCIKPARVLSTDEPGGLPDMIREALGDPKADIRTVHRLDRVVSGVMVLARNARAASELSRQVREDLFEKEYLAVVHGKPEANEGTLRDLLYRDKARKMTMVATEPARSVQEALLGLPGFEYSGVHVPDPDPASDRQNPSDPGSVFQQGNALVGRTKIQHFGGSL